MSAKRGYLIFEDVQKDPSLRPVFDAGVNMVLNNTAKISDRDDWPCFLYVDSVRIIALDVLEYYLHELTASGFDYEKARFFSERMIKLCWFDFHLPVY